MDKRTAPPVASVASVDSEASGAAGPAVPATSTLSIGPFGRHLAGVSTLELSRELCSGCRMCLNVCPQGVFTLSEKKAAIADLDACMECSACATNCPEGALTVRRGVGCAAAKITAALGLKKDVCC